MIFAESADGKVILNKLRLNSEQGEPVIHFILRLYGNYIIILPVIVLLGLLFQKNYINEPPSYRHTWAQADHYALAQRFTENGLNFFKPETYVLNHQFPNDMRVPAAESITAVDFPVHNYIPAVIMKLLHVDDPWIFRGYVLLYSFIGLFFLYKLAFFISRDFFKSLFIVIFAGTSPVFAYYQGSFLPSIPSFSNAVIGMYFYALFINKNKDSHFVLSVLFLTLSALSRTTFLIPLFAVLGWEFIRILKKRSTFKGKILPVILSFSALGGYFLYNAYLRENYGSLFLNHLMPAKSFEEVMNVWNTVSEHWLDQYFSLFHYILLGVILAIYFYLAFKRKVEKADIRAILFPALLMLFGCLLFTVAMWKQFEHHEYYFLDTFFLPVILILIVMLSKIYIPRSAIINMLIVIGLSVPMILNAVETQNEKRVIQEWNRPSRSVVNYINAEEFLNAAGVRKDDKMLVMGTQAPNVPFFQIKRKGYAVIYPNREWILKAVDWDYDYIIAEKGFLKEDILDHYPEFATEFEIVHKDEKLLLFKKINSGK